MRGQEDRQNQPGKPGIRSPKSRTGDGRPAGATAARLLALQRTAGNAAVARAVAEERHGHDANCGHLPGQDSAPVQRSAVHQVLRSAGRPLDPPLRTEMESRLGADFGEVRLHTDAVAQRSAEEIGARAYTSGSHVVVGREGLDKHTLAHELTHVIQQRQGPVAGTDLGDGLRVSDPSDAFERAAEANARHVMRAPLDVQRAVEPRPAPAAAHEGRGGPVAVQTMPADGEKKPPPVPKKPDSLRAGGTALTGAEQTSAAAEPEQAQSAAPAHGYTLAGPAGLVCYRADGRSPEVVRQSGGMRSRNATSVRNELELFLADPIAYARAHVSSPKPTLVSTALDEDCGGYASNDRHVYRIQVGDLYQFTPPPARSKILTKPTVYANSTSLETATVIVIGPVGPTQEMDFIGGIPLAALTGCRRPGESGFSAL
ncbi:eCIS core domain-containing protein [Streptomyces cellulosae]